MGTALRVHLSMGAALRVQLSMGAALKVQHRAFSVFERHWVGSLVPQPTNQTRLAMRVIIINKGVEGSERRGSCS